ncbi:MAG TPA: glycoside hydrolase domain-containing protein [archaeon]|nr:glycoside hydrolase domain-containing protein [archaeon]
MVKNIYSMRRNNTRFNHECLGGMKYLLLAGCLLLGSFQPLRPEITIKSYHLRDRAIVTDSLLLRKIMIFQLKSSKPLSAIKGSAVIGALSHEGALMARDTAYIFDEPGGNLAFSLPYEIPDGSYHLALEHLSAKGEKLDSYSGDFPRSDLRAYFNRGVNFWDYTTPYGHLQCSGYGYLTYRFPNKGAFKPQSLALTARMTTDSRSPGLVKLSLNNVGLGEFDLPAPESGKLPRIVTWRVDDPAALAGVSFLDGENALTFTITGETSPKGMGIRIFAKKNVKDPAVEEGVPIDIRARTGEGAAAERHYEIAVWGEDGEHVTSSFNVPGPREFTREPGGEKQEPLSVGGEDIRRGYVVFRRDPMRYVYPWTVPAEGERADSLRVRLSRNDFEPLTFSVYPLRDLGRLRVRVGDFTGPGGRTIKSDRVQVHVARTLKIRTGGSRYSLVPRLLERARSAWVPLDRTTRFWLTVRAEPEDAPGIYRSAVFLEPEKEPAVELPLCLEVLPVTLEPVPGIDYSMFMSYEFYELESKDWTPEEREKIYRDGVNTFRDYIDHGMTTVDVSSPFYFQWNRDGTPRLEHLKAMLKGAKEVGFKGPVFWYFAHYVQAAKGQHPGNIRNYDQKIHTGRARFLVRTALELDQDLGGPPVRFVPIDEPRIALRQKIALQLFGAVKQVPGAYIMSSTDIGGKLLDIQNDGSGLLKKLGPGEKKRVSERKVWSYNNAVVTCFNPGYARYIYGYFTWRQDLDGMNSWGPNTVQNSRGDPYEDLDHESSDYMLFYPAPGGPLPSVNWEAVREGIDDVRYVYQLEKLISARKKAYPEQAADAERFLDDLRKMCDLDQDEMISEFGKWPPETFESARNGVIDWILKLEKL